MSYYLITEFIPIIMILLILPNRKTRTVEEIKENSPFDSLCPNGIANNTWYHYPGAIDALVAPDIINGTSILQGENIPLCAEGTYYGIGFSTFEPTIGITSQDNIYMSSYGNGVAGATAIIVVEL